MAETHKFEVRVKETEEASGGKLCVRFTNAPLPKKRKGSRYAMPEPWDPERTSIDFSITVPKGKAELYPVGYEAKLLMVPKKGRPAKKGGSSRERSARRNAKLDRAY